MADTPAGWYPNPENPATERWWDGNAWSDQTRPSSAAMPPPPVGGAPYGAYGATPPYGAAPAPAGGAKPDNYLVWSILVTLFCCLPFGIAAIVNSSRVDSLWMSGNYAGALNASEQAKKWIKVSVIIGLVVGVLYFIAIAAGGGEFSYEVGT